MYRDKSTEIKFAGDLDEEFAACILFEKMNCKSFNPDHNRQLTVYSVSVLSFAQSVLFRVLTSA